jgi:hypothetical protein
MNNPESADVSVAELRDPTLRSFVSLALVLHLVCVGFVYSANVNASRLQQRLAGIFAPYTQLLHLDPGGVRLQFTDGSTDSDDHQIMVARKLEDGSISASEVLQLPSANDHHLGERRRLLALSNDLAAYARMRDDLAAALAKSIGESVMRTQNWDHVVVSVRHQGAQPLYDDVSPEERSVDATLYEAEVWVDEDGNVQSQKRATGPGAAPAARERSL